MSSPVFANLNNQKTANQVIKDYNELTISKLKLNKTSDNNFINKDETTNNTFSKNKPQVAYTFSSLREKFERISRADKVFFLFLN